MTRHTPAPPVDIAAVIPGFAALSRTTVRLHPRRGESPIDAAKMGGLILWPSEESWPTCNEHGSALIPVLQLTAEDVPEVGFPSGADLFQLLWCPKLHEKLRPLYAPAARAFWRKRNAIQQHLSVIPLPVRDRETDDLWPAACILDPERVVEYPALFELAIEHPELRARVANSKALRAIIESHAGADEDARTTVYASWLSVADGTKVGGHPHWIQDPEWPRCECGLRMEYLLTVSSAEFDGGNWKRWLPDEERHVSTANYATRKRVQRAANLMLGDMGNINYFICRKCTGCPIEGIFQCS
ncbi:MAG TPA: DUF1963 domain-containing protein [Planctomycetaceae bacterium]|nr:DUF1963 domain-containing protein [Planctomycetaceae bacterium]